MRLPCFLFLAAFLFVAGLQAQPIQLRQPLTLATYAYGQNSRIDNLLPLARHLQQNLQQPVQVVSYASIPALLDAIKAQEVDIALLNTYGYLQLAQSPEPVMQPLMVLVPALGQKNAYSGCLFTLKTSGIQRLTDLRAQGASASLVMAGEFSTSGNYIQRQALRQKGYPDPEHLFKEVRYASSHAQVIQQVKEGVAQVGACGYDELQHHLKTGNLKRADITVLWTSEAIPLGPVVVKSTLPCATQTKLRQVLSQLHTHNKAAFNALRQGWTEAKAASHFKPVPPTYYPATFVALSR